MTNQPKARHGPVPPRIIETIVTTINAAGEVHIAPLGLIADPAQSAGDGDTANTQDGPGAFWTIAPFKPSRTLNNLREVPFACASHTDDVRVFAGGVTGRKTWPLVPAIRIRGARLAGAVSHLELAVESVSSDADRPRFRCRVVSTEQHRPWRGYNRAQSAVIEGAILVSRLHMLPAEKIASEIAYLEIAISKTAGPVETEAWGWLMAKIDAWRGAGGQREQRT